MANVLNLPAIDQAIQTKKMNDLKIKGAEQALDQDAQVFDEDQRIANTRWLAGATKVLMDIQDPQEFSMAANELVNVGRERGVIAPGQIDPMKITPQAVSEIHQQALVGLGNMKINPDDPDKPSRQRVAEWYMSLPPDQQRQAREANAATKAMKIQKIPMSDGTELAVNYDPETGEGFDVQGNPVIVRPGTDGAPIVYRAEGAQLGRTADPVQQRREIKQAETDVTEQVKQQKIVDQQITAVQGGFALMPVMERALESTSPWTAGKGSIIADIPFFGRGSEARNLSEDLLTIKANIGFDRLQRMRAESPTGGALGQVAVQELKALQATLVSLEQSQDHERLAENLQAVMQRYRSWIDSWGKAIMLEGTRDQQLRYYNTIPSGQPYIAPDGTRKVKR